MKPFYYFVLKNYRGIFKKKFVGNSHLFLIPRTDDDYLYLALLGNIVDEDNSYACVLISRIPDDLIDPLIETNYSQKIISFEPPLNYEKVFGENVSLKMVEIINRILY